MTVKNKNAEKRVRPISRVQSEKRESRKEETESFSLKRGKESTLYLSPHTTVCLSIPVTCEIHPLHSTSFPRMKGLEITPQKLKEEEK